MNNSQTTTDTIFAIATPPGMGGVGVIRLSGPDVPALSINLLARLPRPRFATLTGFLDEQGTAIDSGIALYFPAPDSFTGEHVLELQGHGGAVVQQMLSRRLLALGVRPAHPGEFSQRAFLNNKLDLTQAEAIADLVASGTEASVRAAQRSLEGVFSRRVQDLQAQLTSIRVFVEAALDFPDEEIDFIADSDVIERLSATIAQTDKLLQEAHQGRLLRDGITIAIVGRPNAGKSSLLNRLSGTETAIVTDIPGTTRDVIRETISINGLPVHIADTAGLRESADAIEAEGMRRAIQTMNQADLVLWVVDDSVADAGPVPEAAACTTRMLRVRNKADLTGAKSAANETEVVVSASTGQGMDQLRATICSLAGCESGLEGSFSARTRHLNALEKTREHVQQGRQQLTQAGAAELLAEELRMAQKALGEITGEFLPDDLLGAIFSSFCIGK